jgi:hypothetical protein
LCRPRAQAGCKHGARSTTCVEGNKSCAHNPPSRQTCCPPRHAKRRQQASQPQQENGHTATTAAGGVITQQALQCVAAPQLTTWRGALQCARHTCIGDVRCYPPACATTDIRGVQPRSSRLRRITQQGNPSSCRCCRGCPAPRYVLLATHRHGHTHAHTHTHPHRGTAAPGRPSPSDALRQPCTQPRSPPSLAQCARH